MPSSTNATTTRTSKRKEKSGGGRYSEDDVPSIASTSARFKTLWKEIDKTKELFEDSLKLGFSSDGTATKPFISLFQTQVSRVVDCIVSEHTRYEMYAKALLEVVIKVGGQPTLEVWQQVEGLADSYKMLEQHSADMTKVLAKMAVQADQKLGTSSFALLERELGKANKSSAFVVVLNDIYEAIRGATKEQARWSESTFKRHSAKYWIEPRRMTELLLNIVGETPLYVHGESGRLTKDQDLKRSEGDKLWDSLASNISSVYFDSPTMGLYKERIVRHEASQLFRIRWYGDKPQGDELVFLELKTHHEKWINEASVKQRVKIREKDVAAFLSCTEWGIREAEVTIRAANPKLKGKNLKMAIDLIITMHQLVVKHDLRPCVRTKYQRVAFQFPESNKLRLTVDRNITMSDETFTKPGDWCTADSAIKDNNVIHVPYNVLEVKLSGSDMPASIETLLCEGVIIDAAKFSKFLTGAAAFNTTKVDSLPYWAGHKEFAPLFSGYSSIKSRARSDLSSTLSSSAHDQSVDTASTKSESEQEATSRGDGDGDSGLLKFQARRRRREKQPSIAPKRPARVEPKSYFANERTFIQWISACALLTTIAVILLQHDADHPHYSRIGLALLGSATVMVVYSLFVYLRRIKMLLSGESYGYIDYCGPVFLACAVFVGILAIIGISLAIESDESPRAKSDSFTIQPEANVCVQHKMAGLSRLEYQPSDILVPANDDRLLIASLETIRALDRSGRVETETLVRIPDGDFEGLASEERKVYAISEVRGTKQSELLVFVWNSTDNLELFGRWQILTPKAEGIAYVPGNPGKLYVAGDSITEVGDAVADRGVIDVYDLPSIDQDGPLTGHRLNSHLINDGLDDSKISSLHYFEGVLYVLHDNARVVRAWDLNGELLSEWSLPPIGRQWEGLALERPGNGQLRGSGGNLLLHLAFDSPPQVWTLAVKEGENRGEMILPDCAKG